VAATAAIAACEPSPRQPPDSDSSIEVTIFHSGDEHGWLQPYVDTGSNEIRGGVANFKAWLVDREGFDPRRELLLSSGDNWTGPAISSWYHGEPTVAAFNALGYHASTLGNHEFDFGPEVLEQRSAEAEFPFLAANLRLRNTGEPVDFAEPWLILSVSGVRVGIVGLAGTHTPVTAHPERVADFEFLDYREVLEVAIPSVRGAGADLVVLLIHECPAALAELLAVQRVDVDLALAAHCHSLESRDAGGVPVVSSGSNWRTYSVTSLSYDPAVGRVVGHETRLEVVSYELGEANPVTPDPELEALVEGWQQQVDEALSHRVGYTSAEIANGSWEQANWVTDSWLWAYPNADIALSNRGAFRQSIAAGAFAIEDIVGMLPFENYLFEVEITGAQLMVNLEQDVASCAPQTYCHPAVAGITYSNASGSMEVRLSNGDPLDPEATYRVLITDFNYHGGSGFLFESQDPTPHDTSLHWRQPVIDWTDSLDTSVDDPIDSYLDPTPRDQ
jgi:2',3'-cyclic-nucleotide 2'-phosphodiesterase (5'-nucleotidase family)